MTKRIFGAWISLMAALIPGAQADYLDDIGYTALVEQLQASGTSVPDGSGVKVTQVEAYTGTSTVSGTTYYQYLPTTSSYSGVTFTFSSTAAYPGTVSWHADMVGQKLYGNSSMGSGVSSVNVYNANDWLNNIVKSGTQSDVINHSWVGSTGSTASDTQVLNILDYSIERDDYVTVVGIQNSGTVATPNLLSSAYNVISAGVSDGTHMSGSSSINSGVTYPHLVVPVGTTSEATAVVSSAAALLVQTARSGSSTSANGDKSESIKAILLAGATKEELASWSHTTTAPLDATYGAGELNIQNSYNILTAGEQAPSASFSALVATTGWDYGNISSLNATVSYYFDLSATGDISIALTWNAIYNGSLALSLANLNLYLYEVDGGTPGDLVTSSVATTGNIEYIWSTDLAAGSYVIQVKYAGVSGSSQSSYNYALAWQTTVPEPSAFALLALGALIFVWKTRRRARA